MFAIPGAIALVVEPIVFALADRHPRAWFVRGGTIAMAIGCAAAALAPGPWSLALALALVWPAIGCASGLAQATLVDIAPDRRARTIARFALLSLLGDLGAPALLVLLGGDWRAGFAISAAALAAWAIVLARTQVPQAVREPDEARAPLWSSLRAALADRTLLAWLFAMALCDLLDEILVVLASIRVRDDLGASVAWQSATVAALVAGGALGLAAIDRVLRRTDELTALVAAAIACAIAYAVWLAAPTPLVVAALALPVGATAAPLYPLAAARAYAARPDASGEVLAVSHVFAPLALGLPLLLGALADAAGVRVALAALLVQPIGLALLAISARRAAARARPSATPDRGH